MLARIVLIGLVATGAGCGKPSSSAPPTPEPLPQAAADEAELTAALGELTQVVRRFAAEQRRAPKTLDELVAQGYLSRVPEPPAGKKFAINKKLEVYLAGP
jgi:hypothetical protein